MGLRGNSSKVNNLLTRDETADVRAFGDMYRSWRADTDIKSYLNAEGKKFWTGQYKKEQESKDRGEHTLINVTGEDRSPPFFAQEWRGRGYQLLEKGRGNRDIRRQVHETNYYAKRGQDIPQSLFDSPVFDEENMNAVNKKGLAIPNFSSNSKAKRNPEVGVGEDPEVKAFLRRSYADAENKLWDYQMRATKTTTFKNKFEGGDVDVATLDFAEQLAGRKSGDVHKERKRQESLMLNSYFGMHKGGWTPASSIAGGLNGRYGKNFSPILRNK